MEGEAREASKRAWKLCCTLVGILLDAALLWRRRLAASGECIVLGAGNGSLADAPVAGQSSICHLDCGFQHLIHLPLPHHPHLGFLKASRPSGRRTRHLRGFQSERSRRFLGGENSSLCSQNF